MSKNRNKPTDRHETNRIKNLPYAARSSETKKCPNWLRHKGGNRLIDRDLLTGGTIATFAQYRSAVEQHLYHLKKEHGLKIVKSHGIFRFA